jgi:hypothetical protein
VKHLVGPWIVWYAIVLHAAWAVMLLFNGDALGATSTHYFHNCNRFVVSAVFFSVAILAAWSVTRKTMSMGTLLALLPQQLILMVSAYTACLAVWHSAYGDGVIRPTLFILADQLPIILTMVIHTATIIEMHLLPGRREEAGR